jgi:choline dehydrogenase-like flavoprotein
MSWDAIVIGSGFGGAMAAWPLVQAGARVLMLERGGWVGRGPDNWSDHGAGLITPSYNHDTPYTVSAGGRRYTAGSWNCVGGQSVYYGGASFRFRPPDFLTNERIVGDSGAAWPFRYEDIEPFYTLAEQLLGIAGTTGPTDPPRSAAYPQEAAPLSASARRIADAGARVGLTPERIPLAISFDGRASARACTRCGTCDGYACAAEAKNDLATGVIPSLIRQGMRLRTNTTCARLIRQGGRIAVVECVDRINGERLAFRADQVILAAGTLATPHLLLSSNLGRINPAGRAVGRYLTRHRNAVVLGLFARQPNPAREFDKQVVFLDHYAEAGSIQQLTPALGLVRSYLPRGLRAAGARVVAQAAGLIVIAEDQPREANGVTLDWTTPDRFGLPRLRVHHEYTAADEAATAILTGSAIRVLHEAGARLFWLHSIETFSHALGTVRMGVDESTAPLDADGRYRGIDNLYVTDGSALPRSAGLNPSLTIAANALRVGSRLGAKSPVMRGRSLRTLDPLTNASFDRTTR